MDPWFMDSCPMLSYYHQVSRLRKLPDSPIVNVAGFTIKPWDSTWIHGPCSKDPWIEPRELISWDPDRYFSVVPILIYIG